MKQQFFQFIQSPDLNHFQIIRQLVLSHASYDPHSDDLSVLLDLLEAGEYVQVQLGVSRSMPNLLLSPRAHMLAAVAAEQTGDANAAEVEKYISQVCVKGILTTGDGSREAPYRVLRTSDEYDVLQYLGLQSESRNVQVVGEKHCSVFVTTLGREIVFDTSDVTARTIGPEPRDTD